MNMRIRYTLQYLAPIGQIKWRSLSVSQYAPFSEDDLQRYREMLSKRHMVRGDEITFRQITEVQS